MAAKNKIVKEMVINAQSHTPWYVDEITKEIKRLSKCKDDINGTVINGEEQIEIYPKINEHGHLIWHFEVYRWVRRKIK